MSTGTGNHDINGAGMTKDSTVKSMSTRPISQERSDLDAGAVRVHMRAIDTWPNDLGRFASSLTGAHVSDPLLQKLDPSTRDAGHSAL
jgi:hypothetical protein